MNAHCFGGTGLQIGRSICKPDEFANWIQHIYVHVLCKSKSKRILNKFKYNAAKWLKMKKKWKIKENKTCTATCDHGRIIILVHES